MDFPQGACKLPGVKAKSSKKVTFLLSKVRCLKLCPLSILMPLEENPYTVPHLKVQISG